MSRIEAVIFDLGGVLVEVDKTRSIEQWNLLMGGDEKSFENAFFRDRLKERFNCGSIDAMTFLNEVKSGIRAPLRVPDETALQTVWTAMLGPRPYAEEITRMLSKDYKLAILSDTDPIHAAYMETNFGFFKRFGVKIYSFETRAVKPDGLMYSTILNRLQKKPSKCVFFDDLSRNVQGARSFGLKAHTATNKGEIINGLKQENILL